MKRVLKVLLPFTFTFLFLIPIYLFAQRKTYIRVYDQNMEKIEQGWVISTTDTSVYLKDEKGITFSLPVNSIGKIKTRKSGESIIITSTLVGAAAGAATGLMMDNIFGVMYNDINMDENAGLKSFALSGAACGLLYGVIITSATRKKFIINGDINNWTAFKTYVENRMK